MSKEQRLYLHIWLREGKYEQERFVYRSYLSVTSDCPWSGRTISAADDFITLEVDLTLPEHVLEIVA